MKRKRDRSRKMQRNNRRLIWYWWRNCICSVAVCSLKLAEASPLRLGNRDLVRTSVKNAPLIASCKYHSSLLPQYFKFGYIPERLKKKATSSFYLWKLLHDQHFSTGGSKRVSRCINMTDCQKCSVIWGHLRFIFCRILRGQWNSVKMELMSSLFW